MKAGRHKLEGTTVLVVGILQSGALLFWSFLFLSRAHMGGKNINLVYDSLPDLLKPLNSRSEIGLRNNEE